MKLCPYCLQDALWRVRLKSSHEPSFVMCFECDAVWCAEQTFSDQNGTTYDRYMRILGEAADWENLEKIEMIE